MQLLQRLKGFHASFFSGPKPQYDPRYWDSAMYALYPDAERQMPRPPGTQEESARTRVNSPVPF